MATDNLAPNMEHATGDGPKIVNRTELDSQVLALVRRIAARSLPWPASEDFTGELVCRWLDEAKSVGRPNMVRVDWAKAPWIRVEARTYAARQLRPALGELVLDTADTDDESPRSETANWRRLWELDESPDMESEDFTESPAGDGPQWSPVKVRQMAGRLARQLHVHDEPDTIYALIQALAPVAPKQLAPVFELTLSAWQGKAKRGAAHIRACYPPAHPTVNLSKLARELVRAINEDKSVGRRATPLAARTIGAKLPADSHRNGAQMAREADWLITRPQLDGRLADASRASADTSRTGRMGDANAVPAAGEPIVWTCLASFHIPPAMLRELKRGIASFLDESPRRGARPTRQAAGAAAGGITSVAPTMAPLPATLAMARYAHPRFADESGRRMTRVHPSPAWLALGGPAIGPLLTTWSPGTTRATTRAARTPSGPTPLIGATWMPRSLRAIEARAARPNRVSLDVAWPQRDKHGRITDTEHACHGRKLTLI